MSAVTITPHLICKNASEAIEFYKKAFGAECLVQGHTPDGKLMHATLSIGGATFMLMDEFLEHGAKGAATLGGSPVVVHVNVPNVDEAYQKAVDAGCTSIMAPQEMFWGDKYGSVVDPFGHAWSVATTVKKMDMAEMQGVLDSVAQGNFEGPGCG